LLRKENHNTDYYEVKAKWPDEECGPRDSMVTTRYIYQPTPRFSARLKKISDHDPPGYRRIRNVIDRLC
jgi:hypothetical protein